MRAENYFAEKRRKRETKPAKAERWPAPVMKPKHGWFCRERIEKREEGGASPPQSPHAMRSRRHSGGGGNPKKFKLFFAPGDGLPRWEAIRRGSTRGSLKPNSKTSLRSNSICSPRLRNIWKGQISPQLPTKRPLLSNWSVFDASGCDQ